MSLNINDYSYIDFESLSKKFFTLSGEQVKLKDEIKKAKEEWPYIELIIATDSQPRRDKVKYVTVIGIHLFDSFRNGKGCKVFLTINYTDRKTWGKSSKNDFAKLFKEAELTLAYTLLLRHNHNIIIDYAELDLNSDKKFASNAVLKSAIGHLQTIYKPEQIRFKPNTAFTYAADIKTKSGGKTKKRRKRKK